MRAAPRSAPGPSSSRRARRCSAGRRTSSRASSSWCAACLPACQGCWTGAVRRRGRTATALTPDRSRLTCWLDPQGVPADAEVKSVVGEPDLVSRGAAAHPGLRAPTASQCARASGAGRRQGRRGGALPGQQAQASAAAYSFAAFARGLRALRLPITSPVQADGLACSRPSQHTTVLEVGLCARARSALGRDPERGGHRGGREGARAPRRAPRAAPAPPGAV